MHRREASNLSTMLPLVGTRAGLPLRTIIVARCAKDGTMQSCVKGIGNPSPPTMQPSSGRGAGVADPTLPTSNHARRAACLLALLRCLVLFSFGMGAVAAQSAVIEVRVAAASDDAEEEATGSVSLSSSDLELVFDDGNQTVGMRFNGVTIPPGATIVDAYIQFQADETSSDTTSLTIEGEAADNAATFTGADGSISSRDRTASFVPWDPPPWTTVGAAGPAQRTPSIASIIAEIVNRSQWSSGNSLAIIITGIGERTAESFNGDSGGAALLHVEYLL